MAIFSKNSNSVSRLTANNLPQILFEEDTLVEEM